MSKTITRNELAISVHKKIGLSQNECANLVSNVIDEIINNLETGDSVKLSSFGTFTVNSKKERIGRNPKTGEPVSLPEKYVPHFKPGKDLKQKVNESREHSVQIQSS